MIKAIIFDAGGVLLNPRYEDILRALALELNIDSEALISLYREMRDDLLKGKKSVKEWCDLVRSRFNLELSTDEVLETFIQVFNRTNQLNEELFDFAKSLKDRYKVALVSNVSNKPAQINTEKGYYSIFDPCILSCEVGMAKPDKEIFELALEKLNLEGEECIFIDDRDRNFPTAESLGIQVILFENNKQIKRDLKINLNI